MLEQPSVENRKYKRKTSVTEVKEESVEEVVRELRVLNRKPAIVKMKCPSGNVYTFEPGEQKLINEADAKYLAQQTTGTAGCCGNSGRTKKTLFVLVD